MSEPGLKLRSRLASSLFLNLLNHSLSPASSRWFTGIVWQQQGQADVWCWLCYQLSLVASSRASGQQISYFWILLFSWDRCYEEWPPLPHSPCLLFPAQILLWLLNESIVPQSSGLAVMFSLALEPEQWLVSAGCFGWTYKSLYFSHVKTMTKLTKVRKSKLQIDRVCLDCPAMSGHGMVTLPGLGIAVHEDVLLVLGHGVMSRGWKSSHKYT